MTHVVAAFKQNNFRGRGDTVGLNNSTFDHALDTDWTQDTSAVFRVRFLVQETAGGSVSNQQFKIQYNYDSGGWNDVSGTSPIQWAASGQYADEDATTQVLGSGTFITGRGVESDVDTDTGHSFSGNDETEDEFALVIDVAQVTDAKTFDLRLVEADGTVFGGAYVSPTVTVNVALQTLNLSDGVGITDSGPDQTLDRIEDDTVTVGTTQTVNVVLGTITHTVTLGDNVQTIQIAIKSVSESVTVTTALSFPLFALALSTSMSVGDTVAVVVSKSVADAIGVSDTMVLTLDVPLSDAVGIGEQVAFLEGVTFTDATTVGDVLAILQSESLADAATVGDAMVTAVDKLLADVVGVSAAEDITLKVSSGAPPYPEGEFPSVVRQFHYTSGNTMLTGWNPPATGEQEIYTLLDEGWDTPSLADFTQATLATNFLGQMTEAVIEGQVSVPAGSEMPDNFVEGRRVFIRMNHLGSAISSPPGATWKLYMRQPDLSEDLKATRFLNLGTGSPPVSDKALIDMGYITFTKYEAEHIYWTCDYEQTGAGGDEPDFKEE